MLDGKCISVFLPGPVAGLVWGHWAEVVISPGSPDLTVGAHHRHHVAPFALPVGHRPPPSSRLRHLGQLAGPQWGHHQSLKLGRALVPPVIASADDPDTLRAWLAQIAMETF